MAAKPKTEIDKRTQRQKFIDKAHELETDDSNEAFARKLKAIASAPTPAKAKKPTAKKR
ncbi:MAG: DNA-binding protein [Hyphomicrobium sp.]